MLKKIKEKEKLLSAFIWECWKYAILSLRNFDYPT